MATHESGHAVVSWFLEYAEPLLKVRTLPPALASDADGWGVLLTACARECVPCCHPCHFVRRSALGSIKCFCRLRGGGQQGSRWTHGRAALLGAGLVLQWT